LLLLVYVQWDLAFVVVVVVVSVTALSLVYVQWDLAYILGAVAATDVALRC